MSATGVAFPIAITNAFNLCCLNYVTYKQFEIKSATERIVWNKDQLLLLSILYVYITACSLGIVELKLAFDTAEVLGSRYFVLNLCLLEAGETPSRTLYASQQLVSFFA